MTKGVEDGMGDEQAVKAVYPDAECMTEELEANGVASIIVTPHSRWTRKEPEAWADARARLPAAIPVAIPSAPATTPYVCPHGIEVAIQQCHDCAREGYAKAASLDSATTEVRGKAEPWSGVEMLDQIRASLAQAAELGTLDGVGGDIEVMKSVQILMNKAAVRGKASPISADHPESKCQLCGGPNYHWHVDSAEWNAAMRCGDEPDVACIVCPNCFMEQSCKRGLDWQWHIEADKSITPYTRGGSYEVRGKASPEMEQLPYDREVLWEKHCRLMEVIECDQRGDVSLMTKKAFYAALDHIEGKG